jgi:hypothetical protein
MAHQSIDDRVPNPASTLAELIQRTRAPKDTPPVHKTVFPLNRFSLKVLIDAPNGLMTLAAAIVVGLYEVTSAKYEPGNQREHFTCGACIVYPLRERSRHGRRVFCQHIVVAGSARQANGLLGPPTGTATSTACP